MNLDEEILHCNFREFLNKEEGIMGSKSRKREDPPPPLILSPPFGTCSYLSFAYMYLHTRTQQIRFWVCLGSVNMAVVNQFVDCYKRKNWNEQSREVCEEVSCSYTSVLRSIDWLIDWLTDWLTDWWTDGRTYRWTDWLSYLPLIASFSGKGLQRHCPNTSKPWDTEARQVHVNLFLPAFF